MAQGRKRNRERPSADEGLAVENYPGLNRLFYGMSPHGYLRMRLRGLYLWLGNPDGMNELLRAGVEFDEMSITTDEEPDEEDEDEQKKAAVIESEVLLHHVAETLVRLYLIHSRLPPCPWLELSWERDFKKFKKEVGKLQTRLASGEEEDRIHQVFHVNSDRSAIKPTPDREVWDRAAKNIARFLDFYAGYVLDSAPYNAAKHGLAVTAGEQGFEFGVGADQEPVLSRRGPAIEYLKVTPGPDGRPRWSREVKWIRAKRAVPFIYLGCNFIEAIWNIGAGRYGIRDPTELKLFDHPPFEDVMARSEVAQPGLEGVSMDRIVETLIYYED
jgi:hypothetical protein